MTVVFEKDLMVSCNSDHNEHLGARTGRKSVWCRQDRVRLLSRMRSLGGTLAEVKMLMARKAHVTNAVNVGRS